MKKIPAAADPHIARQSDSTASAGACISTADRPRQAHHQQGTARQKFTANTTASHRRWPAPIYLRALFFTQVPGDQHRDAHSQLGHRKGHQIQHLAAGRNRRKVPTSNPRSADHRTDPPRRKPPAESSAPSTGSVEGHQLL